MVSKFSSQSTADEVLAGIDLTGRRILVTGVSSGLGTETARVLTARGAEVIGAARDMGRARNTTRSDPNIELEELDLASLASVRACADRLVSRALELDLIIANAGVMATPFGRTADGFETQFGTNHLGHFVLVNRLRPLLKSGSRVVVLTSGGHRASDVDLDDPGFRQTAYNEWSAYGRSKTANVLFAVEFDRRRRGDGIRAAAVHPGSIDTNLTRHMTAEAKALQIARINANRSAGEPEFRFKTMGQGAATTVWAGVVAAADAVGGRYCEDGHVAEVIDTPGVRKGVRSYAVDPNRARALWALSETMVGERY